jgi:hypothetical protein
LSRRLLVLSASMDSERKCNRCDKIKPLSPEFFGLKKTGTFLKECRECATTRSEKRVQKKLGGDKENIAPGPLRNRLSADGVGQGPEEGEGQEKLAEDDCSEMKDLEKGLGAVNLGDFITTVEEAEENNEELEKITAYVALGANVPSSPRENADTVASRLPESLRYNFK